ncbi:sensor histidine kinase [Stackebrandtia soli]|uniref:sensor histidine kinase n=1 Tax=Stackebrandtia soli TaxID=1892856 RepID=UPI0039E9A54B
MSLSSALRSQTFKAQLTRRFAQVGLVFAMLGLMIAGAVFFVLSIVGMVTIPITIGIVLCLVAVAATRGICAAERAILRNGFGVPAQSPYLPWPPGHVGAKLLRLAKEPATWRDLAWLSVNVTLGLGVYLTVLILFLAPWFYLVYPILWLAWPSVFNNHFGLFYYDSIGGALWSLPIAAVALILWWWLGDLILNSYAKLAGLLLRPNKSAALEQRVEELTESRNETVDSSAAELRRIERDLHDGAQARLVALGMSLGMAEEIMRTDPESARSLLAEARQNSREALAEIRNLVRGIHPPVLADRGLVGAVEALALTQRLPVTVVADLPGRPPAPVESAAYFAIAEAITNAVKYANASSARIMIGYFGSRLGVTIRDDGGGGATIAPGGGLAGVARRLAAFDGVISVSSPDGGPTIVTLEIPCELHPRG